jgi:hypothetical protein
MPRGEHHGTVRDDGLRHTEPERTRELSYHKYHIRIRKARESIVIRDVKRGNTIKETA